MSVVRQYLETYINLNNKCKLYLLLYMIQSITAGISFFIAIFLNKSLSFAPDIIGLIIGSLVAGNLSGSWLTSKCITSDNSSKLSGISLVVQAGCFFGICYTDSKVSIATIMFILGAANYVYIICNNYLITALAGQLESERALAISLLTVSSNVGVAIGGVIVSYLSKENPTSMFLIAGTVLIIMSIFYLSDLSGKSNIYEENSDEDKTQSNSHLYRLGLCIIFLLGLIFAQERVGYGLYLNKYFGTAGASFIFMLNSFLIIFFLPTVIKIAIKKNQILLMGIGGLLLGCGMFMLSIATSSYWLVILICLVTTLGGNPPAN